MDAASGEFSRNLCEFARNEGVGLNALADRMPKTIWRYKIVVNDVEF